jgi:hypothetical protein
MDQGLSRNLADQLHRRQVSYPTIVASALNWLFQFSYVESTGNVHYADPSMRPSLRELLALYEQNTELSELAPTLNRLRYYTKVRQGPTLAIKHRLRQIDADEAELFFKHWEEGTGLAKNDPIYRLREWTLQDARFRASKGRAPAYRYCAYVLKAWNYWREGMPVTKIVWVYSPTKKEAWPIPH